jgi:outer membrane protein assembly factor BamB
MFDRLNQSSASQAHPLQWVGFLVCISALFCPGALGFEPTSKPVSNWPMFRGNPQLTGVANGALSESLELLWKFHAGDVVTSSAAIVDGVVYIGSDPGILYALDLDRGQVRWKFDSKAAIGSSPTVDGDLVFFGNEDGIFHALNLRTGRPKWTFKTGGEIISSANVAADRVVFGSYDGLLYCLAVADGKLLWKHETEGRVHGTPGIQGGMVVMAGCDEHLRVVSLADGGKVRSVPMGGVSGASAALAGEKVFVGTFNNQVLGIDWNAGKIAWTYQHPEKQFPYYSSAAVTDHCVIVGGRDKMVHCLDPQSGRENWAFRTRARVDSSPVIVGKRVYIGSQDGNLYALDIASGREVWRYEIGSPLSASPAIAGEKLVIGSEDGDVYCFGARSQKPAK